MATTSATWTKDLLALAKWAIQSEDLRHRFLFANKPTELSSTPGIIYSLETNIVLAIYEAAIAKGYKRNITIEYERPYPSKNSGNPKRADLAFKESGRGQNWAYIEVKCYGQNGKSALTHDIDKLKTIEQRSQRWILCYRVRTIERSQKLEDLLRKHFGTKFSAQEIQSFPTIAEYGNEGECEIVLAKVK